MKDGYKKQKWTTAAGASAASFLEMLLREKFNEKMESLISLHPILKMYFDSDLSSEIEKNAFLAISDAIFTTADAFTNKGAFSHYNVIGMTLAHIICKRLYLLKLIYHANSGRITKQQFCELAAKDLAIETAALLNTAWDFLGQKLPTFLNGITKSLSGFLATQCNVDPATVYLVADTISGIFSKLHSKLKKYITPEKIEELLKTVIDSTLTAARKVMMYVEKAENMLNSWRKRICEIFGWNVPNNNKDKNVNVDIPKQKDVTDVDTDDLDEERVGAEKEEIEEENVNSENEYIDEEKVDNENGTINQSIPEPSIDQPKPLTKEMGTKK